jgi:hypothetical protein
MQLRVVLWMMLVLVHGCAAGEPPPHLWQDGATAGDGTGTDVWFPGDTYMPFVDFGKLDANCALGTPDNCGYCGDVCPPSSDTPATARVCDKGKCTIECKEEYYDVNTDATDGCEVQDDVPVHDTKGTAKDLGDVSDCDNAQKITGALPSDDRKHQKAPTDRPEGRADWFKLHIDDNIGCIVNADVVVSLANLPTGATYSLKAYHLCDNGTELANAAQTGSGGSKLTVAPSTGCTTMGDDSGTLYIEVAKLSGPHSAATYTLEVEP